MSHVITTFEVKDQQDWPENRMQPRSFEAEIGVDWDEEQVYIDLDEKEVKKSDLIAPMQGRKSFYEVFVDEWTDDPARAIAIQWSGPFTEVYRWTLECFELANEALPEPMKLMRDSFLQYVEETEVNTPTALFQAIVDQGAYTATGGKEASAQIGEIDAKEWVDTARHYVYKNQVARDRLLNTYDRELARLTKIVSSGPSQKAFNDHQKAAYFNSIMWKIMTARAYLGEPLDFYVGSQLSTNEALALHGMGYNILDVWRIAASSIARCLKNLREAMEYVVLYEKGVYSTEMKHAAREYDFGEKDPILAQIDAFVRIAQRARLS